VLAAQADGIAQAQLHFLPDVMDLGVLADVAHLFDQLVLARFLQERLKFLVVIKVVLDGRLAAAGDDQNIIDAAGDGLFNDKLQHRRIDDRQHLLGHRLGRRQEARAHSGGGDEGFGYGSGHGASFTIFDFTFLIFDYVGIVTAEVWRLRICGRR